MKVEVVWYRHERERIAGGEEKCSGKGREKF